jgi:hypothetical protein
MRVFASLLVIAAIVYIGYVVFTSKPTPEPESPDTLTSAGESAARPSPQTPAEPTFKTPAEPVFKSRIPIPEGPPGEKHYAPGNTFYVLERVSYEHASGVSAVVPGDPVRLVKRNPNGTMKVRAGVYEFDVKESQLTNDLDLAREAERKFVLAHPNPTTR